MFPGPKVTGTVRALCNTRLKSGFEQCSICSLWGGSMFHDHAGTLRVFGHNIRRDMLSSIITLNRLTQRDRQINLCCCIEHRYTDVNKALPWVSLEYNSRAEREGESQLKSAVQRFEFVLLIVVLGKVLSAVNVASTCLQSRDVNLFKAGQHLKTA